MGAVRQLEERIDVDPHGVRAIDVARALPKACGRLGYKDLMPLLDQLVEEGRLHRVVPRRSTPYFRRIGS